MKKIAIVILLTASLQMFAQPSIGITAGLNLPWQHIKSESGEVKYHVFPCFNAGWAGDFPLSKKFSLQTYLLLSGKGAQSSGPGWNNTTITRKIRLYYVELPLTINYAIMANDVKILLGAGPSLAWGISGTDRQYMDNTLSLNSDAFAQFIKKFDAGIFCQAAVRKKAMQASVFCNLGMANIFNNDNPNLPAGSEFIHWKNKVVGISLAYLFKL